MKNVWQCAGQWMGGRHGLTQMQHSTAASAKMVICLNSLYPHRPKLSFLWGIRQLDRKCGITTQGGTISFETPNMHWLYITHAAFQLALVWIHMHNYCIALYCIVLYCIVLYCILLYSIELHCITKIVPVFSEHSVVYGITWTKAWTIKENQRTTSPLFFKPIFIHLSPYLRLQAHFLFPCSSTTSLVPRLFPLQERVRVRANPRIALYPCSLLYKKG